MIGLFLSLGGVLVILLPPTALTLFIILRGGSEDEAKKTLHNSMFLRAAVRTGLMAIVIGGVYSAFAAAMRLP